MSQDETGELMQQIHIAAPPAQVWALISDVRQMSRWSPQVDTCEFEEGGLPARAGSRFVNHNSQGELRWTTHGEVVRVVAEQEIAFRIDENYVVWVLQIAPSAGGGTTLTQRRTTPEGISARSRYLADKYLGGQGPFTDIMRAGMKQTVAAIKASAERAAG